MVRKMTYANLIGWTDITPFEVLKETAKTITIRAMDSEREEYKPEYIKGGFAAICINQSEQKWKITSNENNPMIKAYLRKDGNYWSKYGKHKLSEYPMKYYDYNF
jgi:predicted restriction endonuclease